MPRFANTGSAVSQWAATSDVSPSNFDLCRACAFKRDGAPMPARLRPYHAQEPRGVLERMDSPVMDDDLDGYTCDLCRQPLTPSTY